MLTLDHVVISAGLLAEGVERAEAALGMALQGGGQHPDFGTHNRILRMGPQYLEVIAVDPAAEAPGRPRWFDLDRFGGPPRLTNWVMRTDDLDAALEALGPGFGTPMKLKRGDIRWRMALPETGVLPFENCAPAVIEWEANAPIGPLEPGGCSLVGVEVRHPQADALEALLAPLISDDRVSFRLGLPGLTAEIDTPGGVRRL